LENRLVPAGTPALNGITAISANDVWAVGDTAAVFTNGNLTTPELPFAEHFDGTKWTTIPTPALAAGNFGFFDSVAAISSNNVWAVGQTGNASPFSALIEHWDGTKWSIVSSPTLTGSVLLDAVTAFSANNVWAVGNQSGVNLIEHFDGTSWSVASAPSQTHEGLIGISGTSGSDIWAVGSVGRSDTSVQVLHFNGTAWSKVTAPSPDFEDVLQAVSARTTSDAWAVGLASGVNANPTLIEHWNGTQWSIVTSPTIPSGDTAQLNGVVDLASNNAWAVGTEGTSAGVFTLIEHWDGTQWSIVSSPTPNVSNQGLLGIAAVDASHVFADGGTGLIEMFNGTKWSIVVQPTPPPPPYGGGGGGGTTDSVVHVTTGGSSSLTGQPGGMTATVITSPSTMRSGNTLNLAGAHTTLTDADGDLDGLSL
jgi:hypothetical protein